MTPTTAHDRKEIVLTGVAAAPGIATGTAYLFQKETPLAEERALASDAEVSVEEERLDRALQKSVKELTKILAFAQQKVGDQKLPDRRHLQ